MHLQAPLEAQMEFQFHSDGMVDALCGFFDVTFDGSPENPAQHRILLSTAPELGPCTHWGQLSFYLIPQILCHRGSRIPMSLTLTRRSDNHRLMNMHVEFEKLKGTGADHRQFDFFIE